MPLYKNWKRCYNAWQTTTCQLKYMVARGYLLTLKECKLSDGIFLIDM